MSELSTIYIKSYNRDRKLITTKIRIALKSSVNLADDTLILEVMVKEFEQCKVTLVLSGSLPKFNIFYLVYSCLSSFLIYFSQMSFFFFFFFYMCSPSQSPLPPPAPPDPSRSSQCTRSERLSHASNLGW